MADEDTRWGFTLNGLFVPVPKTALKLAGLAPPVEVAMPDGSMRQIIEEPLDVLRLTARQKELLLWQLVHDLGGSVIVPMPADRWGRTVRYERNGTRIELFADQEDTPIA